MNHLHIALKGVIVNMVSFSRADCFDNLIYQRVSKWLKNKHWEDEFNYIDSVRLVESYYTYPKAVEYAQEIAHIEMVLKELKPVASNHNVLTKMCNHLGKKGERHSFQLKEIV